jgi:hypothetical protein
MTAAYSMDLRERALARKAAGETHQQIAEALQIAPSCVSKWARHEQGHGPRVGRNLCLQGVPTHGLRKRWRNRLHRHAQGDWDGPKKPTDRGAEHLCRQVHLAVIGVAGHHCH